MTLTIRDSRAFGSLRPLLDAMRHCKVGGSVVYSTCTMSPAQNEHVVDAALQKVARDNPDSLFGLVNLAPLAKLVSRAKPLNPIWARTVIAQRPHGLKVPSSFQFVPIGIQILPTIAANYGPSFMAKIKRYR
ncbi:hypothetical protein Ciccas_000401 [Cichlidogyrus casuarinus]|uniref:SAM-dependent MTase RsmB/NOP-type domain-containing protein n=1 Tax=Cichlidogyrus casuarinus TaxID=1844966 RepID=A0ABD2QR04_9PLAT